MLVGNIELGENVEIAINPRLNNVKIGSNVKISKNVTIFGSIEHRVEIGDGSYIGMNCSLNGYSDKISIGKNVSIAPNVLIISDSGPNASRKLQRLFPMSKGYISIGDDSWIGASTIIIQGTKIGKCSVVAANSFVKGIFPDFCVIGGTPAKVIRTFTNDEINTLTES